MYFVDIKPYDSETDMKQVEKDVRAIEMEGIKWLGGSLLDVAYGMSLRVAQNKYYHFVSFVLVVYSYEMKARHPELISCVYREKVFFLPLSALTMSFLLVFVGVKKLRIMCQLVDVLRNPDEIRDGISSFGFLLASCVFFFFFFRFFSWRFSPCSL